MSGSRSTMSPSVPAPEPQPCGSKDGPKASVVDFPSVHSPGGTTYFLAFGGDEDSEYDDEEVEFLLDEGDFVTPSVGSEARSAMSHLRDENDEREVYKEWKRGLWVM